MSSPKKKKPKSIQDLPPLEKGGTDARKGFVYQDHVAAGLLIEMLKDNSIEEIWCETHDDITVLRRVGTDIEVEFIQVKALALDQLWSLAKLAERDKKNAKPVVGSSIIEKSLANDRCSEPCRFRMVTTLPPKGNLGFLTLAADAPDRIKQCKDLSVLTTDLDNRLGNVASPNGNGVESWLKDSFWDVYQSADSLANKNKLKLSEISASDGCNLFPDELDELYSSFLTKARDAATADWGSAPEKKKIERAELSKWFQQQLQKRRSPPAIAGTNLESKLSDAGLQKGDVQSCLESRQRYLTERYQPKYMTLTDIDHVDGEVAATLHGLRAKLDSGELKDSGPEFHATCLNALEELQPKLPTSDPPPLYVLQGCMYNISDRCVHRFRRAT